MAEIDRLKGDFSLYFNGEYVVLAGTKLFIFRPDGSKVAQRDDVRRAGRITFFPENRVLVCTGKHMFHMIDLRDGSDIWTAPYIQNYLNLNPLAVSPDGAYAYTYDETRHGHVIARLSLNTPDHEVYEHEMHMDAGATRDIVCDEEGVPCLLKTLFETIGGKRVALCGVRMHDYCSISPGSTTTWKTKTYLEDGRLGKFFFDGPDRILTNDFYIYEPATGTMTDLLENETTWRNSNRMPSICWRDASGRYLCLEYDNGNTIIDLQERRVAAQYAATCFTRGCLVGEEYWICIDRKIHRKPFPAYEERPEIKTKIGMDWYFAKHPELW